MTRFMDKSFSTYAPGGDAYRDNWDRIFCKKPEPKCACHLVCGDNPKCERCKKPEPPKEPEL